MRFSIIDADYARFSDNMAKSIILKAPLEKRFDVFFFNWKESPGRSNVTPRLESRRTVQNNKMSLRGSHTRISDKGIYNFNPIYTS